MCALDNIVMIRTTNEVWTIDEHGEKHSLKDVSQDSEFSRYICWECHTYLDSWPKVRMHLWRRQSDLPATNPTA